MNNSIKKARVKRSGKKSPFSQNFLKERKKLEERFYFERNILYRKKEDLDRIEITLGNFIMSMEGRRSEIEKYYLNNILLVKKFKDLKSIKKVYEETLKMYEERFIQRSEHLNLISKIIIEMIGSIEDEKNFNESVNKIYLSSLE